MLIKYHMELSKFLTNLYIYLYYLKDSLSLNNHIKYILRNVLLNYSDLDEVSVELSKSNRIFNTLTIIPKKNSEFINDLFVYSLTSDSVKDINLLIKLLSKKDYLLENKLTKTDDCVLDENNLFNILTNKILEMKFTKPTKSISSMLLSYMHCLSKLFPYTLHKQKIFAKFLAALSDKSIYYLHKSITIPFLVVFYYFEEIIIKKEIYKI
ncbi:hypothetical protein TUBRATIS_003200 [Tubulinosema ratisbonensis]|uniref:Uncharacterized protein n=1 Tax=Tubulinosema ratisbonensis TaxID=291195 RepID=A0A437APH1_9MICR|nr:hypothetical protein TUBRATIS_003200 [Tubulinosema ratisbonensis]